MPVVRKRKPDRNPEDARDIPAKKPALVTMDKCRVCLEIVDTNFEDENKISVLCRECKTRFHGDCVGVSSNFFYNLIQNGRKGWICYTCKENKMQFLTNISDHVSQIEARIDCTNNKVDNIRATVDEALVAMNEKIDQVRNSIYSELDQLRSVSNTVPSTSSIEEINSHIGQQPSIQSNASDLSYIKSLQRKNNLIFQNIPPSLNENVQTLKSTVVKVAACFGYVLDPNNVVIVIRLRGKSPSGSGPSISTLQRPVSNSLLVKLSDVSIKDELFNCYIAAITQQKFVTCSNIGLNSTLRIYINHHLSPELTKLKIKATELKRSGRFSKLNAKYDCIRVQVNGIWHRVTTMDELDQLSSMDF